MKSSCMPFFLFLSQALYDLDVYMTIMERQNFDFSIMEHWYLKKTYYRIGSISGIENCVLLHTS